jgi:hypothetical protein
MTHITGWALDMSNWSGKITSEWVGRRLAEGWNHGIAGTQVAEITQDQLDDMLAGGMTVDAYVFLYAQGRGTATEQVDAALANVGGRAIGRLWLDFEGNHDAPAGEFRNRWDLVSVSGFVKEATDACIGKVFSGIYTSRSWWLRYMGAVETYKDFPLWLATADGNPNLVFEPFGGWDTCSIEQYVFDQVTDGINCDWNVMGQQFFDVEPVVDIEGARVDLRAALAKLGG